ncbi:MAG: ASKHA domain-containing protein [Anaerolineales bacterium]
MPNVTVVYGERTESAAAAVGQIVGDVIAGTGLPLEQPCAGRGVCGLCKVLAEEGLAPPDEVELEHLTAGELALNNRLACRARVAGDARVVLSPIVVYSNKIFRSSNRYKRSQAPIGLAIDLGTTTVAAFLTMLDDGEVCTGSGSLNQQTVYGADVISRLNSAINRREDRDRLRRLALASINQAVDSLRMSARIVKRVQRVTIVGNVAMHHLLTGLPLENLAQIPFQPYDSRPIRDASQMMEGIFPEGVEVMLPPLIGGFVGSDALACLAYFNFDQADEPMAAIDLGTNGEVMVTDGDRILTASTAAGPAFEGVNISCGSRAVDGAIVQAQWTDGDLAFDTIADEAPIGMTGSGLMSVVHELRQAGLIEPNGRFSTDVPGLADRFDRDEMGAARFQLVPGTDLHLTQWDIRELQKAKGAIRAAINILMSKLNLEPTDLQRVVLTGSFGGQVDIDAVLSLGMIPPVRRETVETIANGAGFGAAQFLFDDGFARGEALAEHADQVDLDVDSDFMQRYVGAMALAPESTG